MNKILKVEKARKCFWTSDLHAFHKKPFVWEPRSHKSAEEHTQFIIDKTNEIVGPEDFLFNLGDITLNCSESMFEEFLSQIKCQNVYTLWGNHNSPSWGIYEREMENFLESNNVNRSTLDTQQIEIYPFRYRNLIFLGNYVEIIVEGQFIVLSHYPLVSWNHMKKGSWMLHGHVHNKLKLNGRRIDVGWDNFKKPVSFQELQKLMSDRPIISDGGHH